MSKGFFKINHGIFDDPILSKHDFLIVWIYLNDKAAYSPYKSSFGGRMIEVKPGQLITGRKKIANDLHMHESKIQRVLKGLETAQLIEQQTTSKNRLITIVGYALRSDGEQQSEHYPNSRRTASEHLFKKKNKNENNLIFAKQKNNGGKYHEQKISKGAVKGDLNQYEELGWQ